MRLTDFSTLRDEIMELARQSSVGHRVRNVRVEATDDGLGGEFLSVKFEMADLNTLEPDEVEPLIKSIENAVAKTDERFPSVRFAEAA